MNRIWNDPVWSKVIAGLILGLVSVAATAGYTYWDNPSHRGQLSNLLFSATIEVNTFILTSLLVLLTGIIVVYLAVTRKKYDIFFSAPMSVNTEEEYQEIRNQCLELIKEIKEHTPFKKVYYAAENKETRNEFTPGSHAVYDDLQALKRSKKFFLFMPKKLPSSAIFEAGYAFKKNLPTVYFCHRDDDIPFLMRDLNDCYRAVSKYNDVSFEKLKNYIKNHGRKLFRNSI